MKEADFHILCDAGLMWWVDGGQPVEVYTADQIAKANGRPHAEAFCEEFNKTSLKLQPHTWKIKSYETNTSVTLQKGPKIWPAKDLIQELMEAAGEMIDEKAKELAAQKPAPFKFQTIPGRATPYKQAVDWTTFINKYDPYTVSGGSLLGDDKGEDMWCLLDWPDVQGHDEARIWTIVEDGDTSKCYVTPGIHYVNRIGYVLTRHLRGPGEHPDYTW